MYDPNISAKSPNDHLGENLELVAACYNSDETLRQELAGSTGWINLTVGMTSEDGKISQAVIVQDGTVSVQGAIPEAVDTTVVFENETTVMEYLEASTSGTINMVLNGKIKVEGNLILMGLFDYLINLILKSDSAEGVGTAVRPDPDAGPAPACRTRKAKRRRSRLAAETVDPGVRCLSDPAFADLDLSAFPRVEAFRDEYFRLRPEVSAEHGKLLTDFFLEHGYETKKNGEPWDPCLRKAESMRYLLANKVPAIRKNDLIAGSYTENPVFGAVGQPYAYGPFYWGELTTFHNRELQPYIISRETIDTLHKHVFPFWAKRNIQELWKQKFNNPLPARIHDRFFSIFFWKTVSIAQICPGYGGILHRGTLGLTADIEAELERDRQADQEKINTLRAMIISLEGVNCYAANLAARAAQEAAVEADPARKAELESMAAVLVRVPMHPAATLREAVQAIFVVHVCLGLENTDDGPALGRLDQLLQPFFLRDMERLESEQERRAYIHGALELMGCLFLRQASHEIPTPELGVWLNSGSPPNATIVVGGVTPEGEDAVNDMSYIILKVTEMLAVNDPNVHVRYKAGVNSEAFLKRACDVNYLTGATPCIHSDDAVFASMTAKGWDITDVRDWTPIGCVEPGIMGKHACATSSLETNLVAPLEMALNNGVHPLSRWALGPETGSIENGDFKTFEDFQQAFETQCRFIFEQGVTGNNQLGEIYQAHHPGPLFSVLLEGCVENGRGMTRGGAKYNSSGIALTGLADVVDSLMAIKKLVFDEQKVSFLEMKQAVDANFENNPRLLALVKNRVPRFGSGNPEALAMARRVTEFAADYHHRQKNYRGGTYAVGFWSMSYHTAYGRLTGALPSGRLAGEPFTPGLTPHPSASPSLLNNLMDVARLDPRALDNNMAFNVRIVPAAGDSHDQAVTNMKHYAAAYIREGGMQLQFNVVDTETLRDAVAHPGEYQDLMVRISGYCGYFTRLHPDLQQEVIRRSEYGI